MECHFLEQKKVKYIKEHLEDSLKILEKEDKPIDVAQLLIELVIVCFIHYLEEL